MIVELAVANRRAVWHNKCRPASRGRQTTTGGDLLEVAVAVPSDRAVRRLIHRTIEFVIKHGAGFEVSLGPLAGATRRTSTAVGC